MKLSLLSLAFAFALSLSGCGLKVVKKQQILDALNTGYDKVEHARDEACSAESEAKLDEAKASLTSLINLFVQ